LLKQLVVSFIVLLVAAAGYVYFVPGAATTLRSLGIAIPVPTAYAATEDSAAANAATAANRRGGARPGGRPGGFSRQAPTVITLPVTTSTVNDKLSAIGQGTAVQSVSVTSQATGTLEKLAVKPGDTVKAGQLIAQLDSDAEQIAYDKARLAAQDAADTLQRTETLAKSNNATTVQLHAAQLAADTADLELRNAKLDLDKRSITTPIDGTVGLFQVTPGNAVGAQTVVTTVDDTSSILIDYWVPERFAPVLKTGMPVSATSTALPDRSFKGTVSAVDSRVDPTSRTLAVEAKIPNAGGAVKPGMSFEVTMAFPGETYPTVDPLAVQWGSSGAYVWQLTADSKVEKAPVAIIQRNSDGVLVKGDLKPGDQVVTQGVLLLSEGMTVRRIDAGGDTASAGPPDKPASGRTGGGGKPGGAPAPGGKSPAGGPSAASQS
jgi:RND family efflux transporter MFP subunit